MVGKDSDHVTVGVRELEHAVTGEPIGSNRARPETSGDGGVAERVRIVYHEVERADRPAFRLALGLEEEQVRSPAELENGHTLPLEDRPHPERFVELGRPRDSS